jgi:Asparagine synthase
VKDARSLSVTVHDFRITESSPDELKLHVLTGWARLQDGAALVQSGPGGIRPLCYRLIGQALHLACYPAQLAALPPRPDLDLSVLRGLPRFVFPVDGTPFNGIHRVPPGRAIRIDGDGTVSPDRQWRVPPERETFHHPRLWNALVAECRLIIAGRRVAVLLSGGLDSSAVAAASFAAAREAGWPDPVLASLVYPGTPCDESAWQESVARHLGGERITVDPVGRPIWPAAQQIARHRLTPMVDVQSSAMGELLRQAEDRGCQAVLTGVGGDLVFRGLGLELNLARQGRLLAVHRHLAGIASAMPVSTPRLWYAGVVRPLVLGTRSPGLRDVEIDAAGSSVRSHLIHALDHSPAGWMTEAAEQCSPNLGFDSPFYGARFLEEFSGVTEADFTRGKTHKHLLRDAIRSRLPAFVVDRVKKANFLDYHRTWLARERESLTARYRELRRHAPETLGYPSDISTSLNASPGPGGFSPSWLALTALEFLAAWNFPERA